MSTIELNNGPVTKEWVHLLPWKKQSAFFSALRGPDTSFSYNIKLVTKFLREASQYDADPTTDYMTRKKEIDWKGLERELEFCTLHYVAHLIEAVYIVWNHSTEARHTFYAHQLLEWFQATFHLTYHG